MEMGKSLDQISELLVENSQKVNFLKENFENEKKKGDDFSKKFDDFLLRYSNDRIEVQALITKFYISILFGAIVFLFQLFLIMKKSLI